ncbi:MAG: N-acetylmuramoyl-L-alanine amidase [Ignavibacteria bacterium]|nr:N-acetylmuramoyl-L-alanine amidase [Ignavibacteria bacterium]
MNKLTFFITFYLILILICSPANLQTEKKKFTVIIDPGHGGKDPGTIGLSKIYEKDINLSVSLKLRNYLQNKYDDIKVVMTREKDEFIELKERGNIANKNSGDLFVSIHCNYKKKEENDKNGFEIYISDFSRLPEAEYYTKYQNPLFSTKDWDTNSLDWIEYSSLLVPVYQNIYQRWSERFASILELEMTKNTVILSRGINQEGFFVLVGASMPVVLLESGFLSNKADETYLKTEKGQEDVAKALYKSIVYYKMDYEFDKMEF